MMNVSKGEDRDEVIHGPMWVDGWPALGLAGTSGSWPWLSHIPFRGSFHVGKERGMP